MIHVELRVLDYVSSYDYYHPVSRKTPRSDAENFASRYILGVFFDGEYVYEAVYENFYESEGFSSDGMRRTGGDYYEKLVPAGEAIPLDDVPEEIRQKILSNCEL